MRICSSLLAGMALLVMTPPMLAEEETGSTKTVAGCAVTTYELEGGRQEDVQLVSIDNGKLRIWVVPTRGLSILKVERKGANGQFATVLGWNSPVKEIINPAYIDLESRGGLGWLEGFNEWMVRCGLEYAGHPGEDVFIDNTGAEARMNLSLHGKIGNIPATSWEVVEQEGRVVLKGAVNERMFFGPKFELVAGISTQANSESFQIHDEITNHGGAAQEMMLLYHCNFGRPLLEQGAQVVVAAKSIAPMNDTAAMAIDDYATYLGPTENFSEQVYLVHPLSDAGGRTSTLLKNKAGSHGCSLSWSTEQLPYLTIWKNTTTEADGYVTGLEPGTCFPYNRSVERAAGRVRKLPPGSSHEFTVDVQVHASPESVQQAEAKIRALQGDTKPILDREPPAH